MDYSYLLKDKAERKKIVSLQDTKRVLDVFGFIVLVAFVITRSLIDLGAGFVLLFFLGFLSAIIYSHYFHAMLTVLRKKQTLNAEEPIDAELIDLNIEYSNYSVRRKSAELFVGMMVGILIGIMFVASIFMFATLGLRFLLTGNIFNKSFDGFMDVLAYILITLIITLPVLLILFSIRFHIKIKPQIQALKGHFNALDKVPRIIIERRNKKSRKISSFILSVIITISELACSAVGLCVFIFVAAL